MKQLISFFAILIFTFFGNANAQPLSGTYSIPGTINSTSVTNLTSLASLLGSNSVTGTAIFEFTSSYAGEPSYPVVFTSFSGGGNVIIRPASSVVSTLTTAGSPVANALIYLLGISNITFDGRAGGTGSSNLWQFQNTTASSAYPAFAFINGASNVTLQYLNIQSSGGSSSQTILFGTSTVAGGNSNNVIQYCNIAPYAASPYTAIYSNGTAGANANSNNSILNNNIYNFQGFSNGPPTNGGVVVTSTGNGSNWTISGNSFYSSVTTSQFTSFLTAISFAPGSNSNGNIISGNYIGGRARLCGTQGDPWVFNGRRAYTTFTDFTGIYVSAGTGSGTVVSNNLIQNMKLFGPSTQTFSGIHIGSGIVTVSGNTIGSSVTSNSILVGNAGVTVGIWNESTSSVTINNNIVGNLTSDFSAAPTTTTPANAIGIYGYTSGGVLGANTITNNQVFNIAVANNYNFNQYFPLNGGGGLSIPYNIISNMGLLGGIYVQTAGSSSQLISKNVVYGLQNKLTGGTNKSYIYGITAYGGTGTITVNANIVYGLWAADGYGNTGNFTGLIGIYLPTGSLGTYNIRNNMIQLGYKSSDGSSVQNSIINGIWDNSQTNNVNLKVRMYHNSVFIGGTDNNTKSNNLHSYAFRRALSFSSSVYDSLTIRNNIFVNYRSTTSGAGKNYGIYLNSNINSSSDYNDIYGTGTGFIFGNQGGTDYANLAIWKAVALQDINSISSDPLYISPTTSTPDLHVQNISPIDQAGTPSFTVSHDIDSTVRVGATPVDIGADAIGNCGTTVTPAVIISVSQNNICSGTTVNFTATPTNGGVNPTYQWQKNGSNVGTGTTYSSNSLANNDVIKVIMTSGDACASPATATSNSVTMIVNLSVTPSVSISVSQNGVCSGTSVSFTATPVNGGTTPNYNWTVNGVSAQISTSRFFTFSFGNLQNGDIVCCEMTSNASCASPTTAISCITMSFIGQVIPSVTISASQNNICQGTTVNFTATPVNGGTTPTYQWEKNGSNVGIGSTYSSNSLANNDVIKVLMTSNAPCASPATVTSNSITITVSTSITPSVSITASQNTICSGTTVNFTASPTNGGNSPIYQWQKNGSNVGTGAIYSNNTLANNDVIKVLMTSNAPCASPATVTSNNITITVSSSITPSVSITASQNNVCAGTTINFTATPVNGGGSPVYQWQKNGSNVGIGTTYSSNSLANNDVIKVVMTSNDACASPSVVTSNSITMIVNPILNTGVTISSSKNNICPGTLVTFSAVDVNGGTSPAYQWKVNGGNVGSNTPVHSSSSLSNGDMISVVMTSNVACPSPSFITSNTITMTVYAPAVAGIVTAVRDTICSGTPAILSVTGSSGNIQWQSAVSNSFANIQGETNTSYTGLPSGTTLYRVYTTNSNCSDTSSAFQIIVKPSPVSDFAFNANGLEVLFNSSGSSNDVTAYEWDFDDNTTSDDANPAHAFPAANSYHVCLKVFNGSNCSFTTCKEVTVMGFPTGTISFASDDLKVFPNPLSDELFVSLKGGNTNILSIDIFDILGRKIYYRDGISDNLLKLNVSELKQGIYFLSVTTNKERTIVKLTKE